VREYTKLETIGANTPYIAMVLLGGATMAYAYGSSAWALTGAAGYLAYGVAGAFWVMIFVCPYCAYHGTTACPCGYGALSARMVGKGDRDCFAAKFKRHIPAIVPLWMIPIACGGMALWHSFSWRLVGLVAVFVVESWIILPIVSRRYACTDCPQKDDCPWMTVKKTPQRATRDQRRQA